MAGGIWAGMMLLSLIHAALTGQVEATGKAAVDGARRAAETALLLAGAAGFFSGIMGLLRAAGAADAMRRLLKKRLGFLFPGANDQAMEAIAMNLSANMLGLGNAATPAGLEAMRHLPLDADGKSASHAMCMFIIINASSIQLIPATVLSLRAAAGSASPGSILLPTLLATSLSTAVGILLALVMRAMGTHGRMGR